MRDFVKFPPSFWINQTGRVIRKSGQETQLVALYLLTSPHANYIGLYVLPLNYIAADTGLPIENVKKALEAIERSGMARYDEDSETVWIIEAAKSELGELSASRNGKKADNRIPMIRKSLAAIPSDCPFIDDFRKKYD